MPTNALSSHLHGLPRDPHPPRGCISYHEPTCIDAPLPPQSSSRTGHSRAQQPNYRSNPFLRTPSAVLWEGSCDSLVCVPGIAHPIPLGYFCFPLGLPSFTLDLLRPALGEDSREPSAALGSSAPIQMPLPDFPCWEWGLVLPEL